MRNKNNLINIFNKLSSILDSIINIISHISVFLFALMNAILIMQIAIRFIPGFSLGWTAELSRMLLVSTAFLGSIIVERYHEHMKVPIITDRLPETPKRIMIIISNIFIMIVMFVFLYGSFLMMIKTSNVSLSSMNFPIGYIYFTLFLCALFIIIIKIFKLVKNSLLLIDEKIVEENLHTNE